MRVNKIMTGRAAPRTEPYRESVDYEWTEKAFALLGSGDLHGEAVSRDGVVSSRVWGKCPRCGHGLDDRRAHTAVTNLMGGEQRGSGTLGPDADGKAVFVAVDVSCGCGDSHLGAPASVTGCGASFRVELPLQRESQLGQP